ncbi:hypothetical protein [Dysgonomonas sp. 511]|uniref:hypothetical protein n=1 Tax=Dysgonomonas sp. 511 TaxID=2302930 RepID=UPI0013D2B1B0|nr:hypothetical protein [Dysgonomonas sp. 511]NDV78750.1 hypothetical protein [Dysgonomonas sp. 511]
MKLITIKQIFSIVAMIFSIVSVKSQTIDDFGKITLQNQISSSSSLSKEAISLIETKMKEIVANNGIASTDVNPRFVITTTVNVLSKDIVAGPPQMVSQNFDITFSIDDMVEQKIFSTTTISFIGVGTNETKALIGAIKKINPNNPDFTTFIENGKTKIIAFYQANCESIIKTAAALSQQGNYNQAIYNLALIPDVCSDCYHSGLRLQGEIYTKKIEAEGKRAFQKAQSLWSQSPNKEIASQVMNFVSQINPDVSFFQNVISFVKEVSTTIQNQELREWEQSVKEYNDRLEHAKKQSDRDFQLRQMRIKTYREIAVEYAKNQPKREIYNTLIIR